MKNKAPHRLDSPRSGTRSIYGIAAGICLAAVLPAGAATIYASGRNTVATNYPVGNYYYSIDTNTGIATPISPALSTAAPTGLGAVGSQLVGFKDGTHGTVNPFTGTFTPVGTNNGLTLSGYEVFNGYGYGVPSSGTERRLQQIDITTSMTVAIGTGNSIGSTMDVFYGNLAGTNSPSILSLGSVGNTLYGVNSGTGKNNLFALDTITGGATILGTPNAVATSGNPGATYSGFAALTGVDENGDGIYDSLYGNVNFYNPDGSGPAAEQNYGGVVKYDLANGTWNLVGSNSGILFFGFGSPVPEPGTTALAALGFAMAMRRRRSK